LYALHAATGNGEQHFGAAYFAAKLFTYEFNIGALTNKIGASIKGP